MTKKKLDKPNESWLLTSLNNTKRKKSDYLIIDKILQKFYITNYNYHHQTK